MNKRKFKKQEKKHKCPLCIHYEPLDKNFFYCKLTKDTYLNIYGEAYVRLWCKYYKKARKTK